EQIYLAYSRYLPSRHKAAQPTRILLYGTMAEYDQTLKQQGRSILNPALYDPSRNEIICGSDLRRLALELEKYHREHEQLQKRLAEQRAELSRIHKGSIPPKLKEQLDADWQKICETESANSKVFDKATARLFRTLYHESFHAYLANFVYSPDETELPRW